MKCPHCNAVYSLNAHVFMKQTCENCGKKLYKDISQTYSIIKCIGRFLALVPFIIGCCWDSGDAPVMNLVMYVVSFVAFIIVELICMKIAPSLKLSKE